MAGRDFIVASSQLPVVSHSWFFFTFVSPPEWAAAAAFG